jgi:hypothetical protein
MAAGGLCLWLRSAECLYFLLFRCGGGVWTRTNDLGIMSPSRQIEDEEDKGLGSAKSSRTLQNPQQNSNNPKR